MCLVFVWVVFVMMFICLFGLLMCCLSVGGCSLYIFLCFGFSVVVGYCVGLIGYFGLVVWLLICLTNFGF